MWTCSGLGLVRFHGDRSQFFPFPKTFSYRPTTGCRGSDGRIWTAGGSVITSWDGTSFTRVLLNSVSGDPFIRAVLCSGEDVWVGTAQGLVRLHGGHETLYTTKQGLADNIVLSLGRGRDGIIWAGTRNGFSRLRNGAFESYGYRDGLSQNAVFAIREDREGSLWVATKNGLNQFLDGAAARYSTNEGLPSDSMGPVFTDHNGVLWAGTLDAGLARFDGLRFRSVPSLSAGKITTLAETGDGSLWAGTDQGLKRLEGGRVQATYGMEQGLPSPLVQTLFRDHTGNLWVGTRKGPAVLANGRFSSVRGMGPELSAPISAIGETRDGAMLFAVEHGSVFTLRDDGSLRRIEAALGPDAPILMPSRFQDVNAIYTDADGVVWMGMQGAGLAGPAERQVDALPGAGWIVRR